MARFVLRFWLLYSVLQGVVASLTEHYRPLPRRGKAMAVAMGELRMTANIGKDSFGAGRLWAEGVTCISSQGTSPLRCPIRVIDFFDID
jgi:hypothetical protein